jgi:hypothetical protein
MGNDKYLTDIKQAYHNSQNFMLEGLSFHYAYPHIAINENLFFMQFVTYIW